MKLVMTLLVSDEVDLVEPAIDYHLARGVDFVIVTVNRGSAELVEKIERYVDEGLVSMIEEPSHTYAQAEWVTRMARLACTEHGADWVINADPDEFYWPEQGDDLKEIFALIPEEYGQLPIPVCHFPPRADCDGEGFFLDTMTVRETRSMKPGGRAPFFKMAHRGDPMVEVARGNHKVFGMARPPVPGWRPIVGFHFPLRCYEQFERKVIRDGHAVANNPDAKVATGLWRDLYELHRAGGLEAEYAQRALDPTAEATGISSGRLIADERLRGWFREHRPDPTTAGSNGAVSTDALERGNGSVTTRERVVVAGYAPAEVERTERLRAEMMMAIYVGAREPEAMERDALLLEKEELRAKAKRLKRKVDRYQRKQAAVKARFRALKAQTGPRGVRVRATALRERGRELLLSSRVADRR